MDAVECRGSTHTSDELWASRRSVDRSPGSCARDGGRKAHAAPRAPDQPNISVRRSLLIAVTAALLAVPFDAVALATDVEDAPTTEAGAGADADADAGSGPAIGSSATDEEIGTSSEGSDEPGHVTTRDAEDQHGSDHAPVSSGEARPATGHDEPRGDEVGAATGDGGPSSDVDGPAPSGAEPDLEPVSPTTGTDEPELDPLLGADPEDVDDGGDAQLPGDGDGTGEAAPADGADDPPPVRPAGEPTDGADLDDPPTGSPVDDGVDAAPVGPEPASSTATIVRTGHALAVGNDSDNHVVQVIDVLVYDGGSVRIEQVVLIINIGSADASTGRNSAQGTSDERLAQAVAARDAGVEADQRQAAHITSGRAIAIGNATITDIEQLLELDAHDGRHVTATQLAEVDNRGVAVAVTGENTAIAGPAGAMAGGSAVVISGDAYAIGNLSDVVIEQAVLAAATGDASILADQQVLVANRGIALADTGSNLALAGSGAATAVGSGVAVAEGNVASNRVTQLAVAVAGEGAGVDVRQGSVVVNLGVAVATSGANHLGTVPAEHAAAALGTGVEELLVTLVLSDPDDLQRFVDALLEQLSMLFGDLTLLDHVVREHSTDHEDDGGRVRLDQRVLVLELGMAAAATGDNLVVPSNVPTADDGLRGRAIATITTGDALAIGNLAITSICQRSAVNRELTEPCPLPEPSAEDDPDTDTPVRLPVVIITPGPIDPGPEADVGPGPHPGPGRHEHPERDEDWGSEVLGAGRDLAPVTWVQPPVVLVDAGAEPRVVAAGPALPRTGADATWLAVAGSLLLLAGTGLLGRSRSRTRRGPERVLRPSS